MNHLNRSFRASKPMLAGLTALALSSASHAASFQGLGDLTGTGFFSEALGVSADGSVVVGRSFNDEGYEAFRWTAEGGMVGLGYLPGGSGNGGSAAVSANGSVIVGSSASDTGTRAFRWTEAGGMAALGTMNSATGVSADGSVVVGNGNLPANTQAFRWNATDGVVSLGYMPGGGFNSQAIGVSADGTTIVGRAYSGRLDEAFRWTAATGMVGLGYLAVPPNPFGSGSTSVARAASADGSVVVGYDSSIREFKPHNWTSVSEAFLWTEAGGMRGLGFLPGDYATGDSYANAVSADGKVVVGRAVRSDIVTSSGSAFIWDAANGMRDLATVLASFGLDLTGWNLGTATGISADGLTIVGTGTYTGARNMAWIARLDAAPVPLPAAVWLMGSALAGIGVIGRKRTVSRKDS